MIKPGKDRLTLEDIAQLSGVSRSTVSRVINQQPSVSEPVRRRVLEIIQETGYQPHQAARSLASHRSWMIGLVLPRSVSSFFIDPYFPRFTQGVAQACNQHNYTLGLFLVESRDDERRILPRISRMSLLDGIVLQAAQPGDKLIDRLIGAEFPVVVAGRPFATDGISYIDVDNVQAANVATTHLIKLGYVRVAHITGQMVSTAGIDRKRGYMQAINEQGGEVDESLIAEGDFTEGSGYQAMQRLLPMKPDAVFAASDTMAIGAMRAVRETGLRIPADVAFVGFDDLPSASRPEIKLTTIRQPIVQFGIKAVETLIDLIENGIKPTRRIIMGTELIIRESCGASRRSSPQAMLEEVKDQGSALSSK